MNYLLEKLRKAEENSEKLRKDETVAKIDKRLKKSWLKFSSFRQLYNTKYKTKVKVNIVFKINVSEFWSFAP